MATMASLHTAASHAGTALATLSSGTSARKPISTSISEQQTTTTLDELLWPPKSTCTKDDFAPEERTNIAGFIGSATSRNLRRPSASEDTFKFDTTQYPDCSRKTQERLVKDVQESFLEQHQRVKVHQWANVEDKRNIRRIRLRCSCDASGCNGK